MACGHRGVLILGASGAGKSALSLELISRGATLIADDRVILKSTEDGVFAMPPSELEGRIEARDIGIIQTAWNPAPIVLVVDLDRQPSGRLPAPQEYQVAGHRLAMLAGKNVPTLAAAIPVILDGGIETHI